MTTNISVVDDYTMSRISPQPVVTMFALHQPPPAAAPLGTVEPEAKPEAKDEDEDEAPVAEAKVVKSPGRAAAKASTEGVETK